jgi:cytochrome c oxidase subunit III
VSITVLFILVPIGAIVAWWLSQQRLTAKPWLEVGAIGEIGLGVFLAVVSSLFALFFVRMQVAD